MISQELAVWLKDVESKMMEESNVWFTSVPTCAYLIIGLDSWWFEPTSLARTYIPCTYTVYYIYDTSLDIEDIYIYMIIFVCILYTVNLHVRVWIVFAVCGTADAAETRGCPANKDLNVNQWCGTCPGSGIQVCWLLFHGGGLPRKMKHLRRRKRSQRKPGMRRFADLLILIASWLVMFYNFGCAFTKS